MSKNNNKSKLKNLFLQCFSTTENEPPVKIAKTPAEELRAEIQKDAQRILKVAKHYEMSDLDLLCQLAKQSRKGEDDFLKVAAETFRMGRLENVAAEVGRSDKVENIGKLAHHPHDAVNYDDLG